MGYIVLSIEEVHIMPDSEGYELSGNILRLYDDNGDETATFNFDNVITIQPATEEEMEALMDDMGLV